MGAIEEKDGCPHVRVRVQPRASRNEVVVEPDGRLRVALTAPPLEGKANKALRAFMAKTLGVPKGRVELVSGEKSRDKVLRIPGLSVAEVEKKLGVKG